MYIRWNIQLQFQQRTYIHILQTISSPTLHRNINLDQCSGTISRSTPIFLTWVLDGYGCQPNKHFAHWTCVRLKKCRVRQQKKSFIVFYFTRSNLYDTTLCSWQILPAKKATLPSDNLRRINEASWQESGKFLIAWSASGEVYVSSQFVFYFLLPNQASSFGQSTPLPKAGKVSLCCHTLSRPLTFWLCSSRQVRGARSVGEASTDMRHFDMTRGDRVIFYIFSEQPEIKAIET